MLWTLKAVSPKTEIPRRIVSESREVQGFFLIEELLFYR